jgi:hypothetical protein
MVALVVFGLASLVLLQTDEFPDVAVPLVVVAVPYPGASPDNVEREIVDPLEESISGISGVKKAVERAGRHAKILVESTTKGPAAGTQGSATDQRDPQRPLPEMKEPVLAPWLRRFSDRSLAVASSRCRRSVDAPGRSWNHKTPPLHWRRGRSEYRGRQHA